MLEELKQRWKKLGMKGWILYYHEKRKNAEIRRAIQQASYPTEINVGKQGELQHRDAKKHNSQSITHAVSKSNDSRAANNNRRAKGEGVKRGRKRVATGDSNK